MWKGGVNSSLEVGSTVNTQHFTHPQHPIRRLQTQTKYFGLNLNNLQEEACELVLLICELGFAKSAFSYASNAA